MHRLEIAFTIASALIILGSVSYVVINNLEEKSVVKYESKFNAEKACETTDFVLGGLPEETPL